VSGVSGDSAASSGQYLRRRHCVPCHAGTPPLSADQATALSSAIPGWEVREGKTLRRRLRFKDFKAAMAFVNQIADLAEGEGHHPDMFVSYDRVRIDLTTHAIGGLSENDFIMAAKIDALETAAP
jgi:4a-hydroxytetrahydrobiopterin dehydratase